MTGRAPQKRQRAPIDVFKFRNYREFLAANYQQKKQTGLSYRGFARAAGLGAPNYLKLVIDGSRNLSAEMAERFARACKLNAEGVEYFKVLVAENQAKDDAERNQQHEKLATFARFRSSQRLDIAEQEYHSSWYIPAIRELVACADFQESPDWIASAMLPEISEKQAAQALSVLLRLGLLERDENGRLAQASRAVSTGQEARGLHIRNYHTQMMTRAIQSMQDIVSEERYISALTLSTSEQNLAEVRRRVIEFRQELVALCDADPNPSKIVQLNLQLFPLSHAVSTESQEPGSKKSNGKAARSATKVTHPSNSRKKTNA